MLVVVFAGCTRRASEIKEGEFARQRADYLALTEPKDQQAVEAFNHFFDAERFRQEYWIHLASGSTNTFWWGSVDDSPEFNGFTVYMTPLSAIPLDRDSVYHVRPHPPVTKESVTAALKEGYADLKESGPIAEFTGSPAVVASCGGRSGEDTVFMTLIADFHGKFFAIAAMTPGEYRGQVIKHLMELLETAK
jgi:hypothetical protein